MKEKAEADRIAKEKAAADKAEADKLAKEKKAAEKAAAEKAAAEKDEADRIAKEKAAADKAAADKAEAERAAAEKEAAEKAESKTSTKDAKYSIPGVLGADKYKETVKRADDYFKTKRYKEAKAAYEEALKYRANDPYATSKLSELTKIMGPQ